MKFLVASTILMALVICLTNGDKSSGENSHDELLANGTTFNHGNETVTHHGNGTHGNGTHGHHRHHHRHHGHGHHGHHHRHHGNESQWHHGNGTQAVNNTNPIQSEIVRNQRFNPVIAQKLPEGFLPGQVLKPVGDKSPSDIQTQAPAETI